MTISKKQRINASLALGLLFTLTFFTMLYATTAPVLPIADLAATYPQIPGWALTSISAILNAAGTVGAIAAVLGTFGLGAIASLVFSYAKKYGIRYAIAY
ncbi:hypothetical protein SFC27_20685 [Bacillus licheniformis]|jgi:hypothetical protein|uniref:Circular bacteriocin, circularin A/uberolysin family n=3 Tax=Bacillus TaxID=1386 RepID=A0AB37GQS9_BACLI|nr:MULTISPECIES: hypothetical protein [Bacillus]MBJ7886578.1 hypothetical protein [Bacillaceae bacterium HSR45]MBY8347507.1 hypothetical protein [Bacillus sp. PCH94]MDP4082652.1 hypothetical protein [Bacillota bacterium]AFR74824.1 hypothetical protein BLi05031 [Bacillus licheniformis DSM 13 = ATCC 14580]AKQ74284.1 hypothetical protein MUY_003152 [Bacillus licheniformis WX-02]